ncbi:4'-phosphopantetheinyl transferase [Enterococcus sp. BWR-S5]|uniref:4'-phosphopantetheinyl transferase n=1 Tax=Enterococcus sp. BWR-S5 TaxID=2787714 RepID=UPI001921A48C|nr:4'-phosphopantetheinyl transferase [Enterococcus sp. BWR-S5]MBL1224212.1 4'-phosphopantetheinyl transferase [Enterococcus sp. BWR-S5]
MLSKAIEILKEQVNINASENDWGYESVLLEQSELDGNLFPENYCHTLPKRVLVHSYIYQDAEAADYVAYFITNERNQHEYIRGLLKNGQLIWWNSIGNLNEND